MKTAALRRMFAALFAGLAVGATAEAQNAVYAAYKGQYCLVRRVDNHDAYVDPGDGKLAFAPERRFGLKPVEEYLPMYVSIRHLQVTVSGVNVIDTGAEINNGFEFRAEFESAFPLKNVFVVLDLNLEEAGKTLFLQGIGDLKPRQPKPVAIYVPTSGNLGAGHYHIHVFSDGNELFHSEMPEAMIDHAMDAMVGRRVKGLTDAAVKPFVGPAPEYPVALKQANVEGRAVIHFTVSTHGRVLEPSVKSATDPAFGESALAAARLWRFLPRVKDGKPIASTVDLPFVFSNAAASAPKS